MRVPHYVYDDGQFMHIDMVRMECAVFDELVVMRFVEMTQSERSAACDRAIRKYSGNVGCDALCGLRGSTGFREWLKNAVENLRKERSKNE
jgi:hypothetical protein